MSIYMWNDALKVNHPKIDHDHKVIIEKAAELSRYMTEGTAKQHVIEMVDFLNRYVKTHFAEEEKIQKQAGYPKFKEHQLNHQQFIKQLNEISLKIKSNPTSAVHAIELNQLISGWFINHIKKMDGDLAKHLHHT